MSSLLFRCECFFLGVGSVICVYKIFVFLHIYYFVLFGVKSGYFLLENVSKSSNSKLHDLNFSRKREKVNTFVITFKPTVNFPKNSKDDMLPCHLQFIIRMCYILYIYYMQPTKCPPPKKKTFIPLVTKIPKPSK